MSAYRIATGSLTRLLIAVVATLAVTTMISASPAAAVVPARATVAIEGAGASCDNPPDAPDATEENRDRFVGLWSERFADQAWLDDFTAQASVPADILAEGFHAMDDATKRWLASCLAEDMFADSTEQLTAAAKQQVLLGVNLVVFGKEQIAQMREELNEPAASQPTPQLPSSGNQTSQSLSEMSQELLSAPSLVSADHPDANFVTPDRSSTDNLKATTSPGLRQLINAPTLVPDKGKAKAPATPGNPQSLTPGPILGLPILPILLEIVDTLLQIIADVQGVLFTVPVLNLLAPAFYKICAEAPTMPLKCSISLPVGIPIPADVNGDNFPDVLGKLTPMLTLKDVGARFSVTKLVTTSLPLKSHVFAVYDTPIVKKRIQVGFDGRSSSLAKHHAATALLKNALLNLPTGDLEVGLTVDSDTPGTTESLTFAVKDLVGGSIGVQPSEENPLAGAVQMSPFPTNFSVNAHLTHTNARSQDTFTVASSTPTKVDAIINQQTTTTSPKSDRTFTATVDKLPTSVTVDLVREGEHQSIDYTGSAPINLVRATDTSTLDTSHPGSFTQSIYEVKGVPTNVSVDMQGTEDILYSANAKIPEVSFSTQTRVDNVLQQQITAKAHQIPKSVHVTNLSTDDQTAVTYDADSELQDVELTMYDLAEDEMNLVAKATGIPTHLQFTQTKDTGVFDFSAPGGIDLIEATLTRGGGSFIDRPGDHATVLKVGDGLGLDLQLTGFESVHFDGSEDTTVAVGLNPGGQSFEVIADLDDPNVFARAFVSALPSSMQVTLSPSAGSATYSASSVIPLLEASFTLRDTMQFASATLTQLPKNIALGFNTTGDTPQITYDADSRLGSIEATYQEAPGAMTLYALISDLPPHMTIGGQDPMVFDARSSAAGAPGSSYLGQVKFQYATDGAFAIVPTPDDHAYIDTVGGTHAELVYSGLQLLSVDTSDEELHVEVRNTAPRMFRAFVTTPTVSLTGFIDKVPAQIQLAQVGNLISYDASSSIDRIFTDLERDNGDTLQVDIHDIPASVDVLFDGLGSTLAWNASAATGSISALAHLTPDTLGGTRAFDAALTITSIPAQWNAGWANGNVLFNAPNSIGSIDASVTNHGSVHTLAGDHLHAFFNEPAGDLDASLKISNLRKIAFNKLTNGNGGGFNAELRMGNGGDLNFGADVTLSAGSKLKVLGGFDNLPTQVNMESNGGRITYTGNSNPDLTISIEAGQSAAALAATPTPPSVHGVSVRDGQSGANKAVKAKLFMTGLPTGLDLNSPAGTYSVTGYHPSIATLSVNAILTTLAPQPVNLQVTQVVPTASPVNFQFGPFLSSTDGSGNHTMNLTYTANQDLGALTAEVIYGNTDDAKLEISEIPKSIVVSGLFAAEQKTVNVTMDHGISDITASYKKAGEIDFAASVHLHDVPKWVNLTIGRGSGSSNGTSVTAPDFTYTGESAGLDINAAATAAIATPVNANAAVELNATNFGHTVTGQLEGRSLHVTSQPELTSFLLKGTGEVGIGVDLSFDEGIFQNTGNLDVHVDIDEVTLGFQNMSDVRLDLGITTGVRGDFSQFDFGLFTDTEVHIVDDFDIFVDWPDPLGSTTWDVVTINEFIDFDNLIEAFHINSNTWGAIFELTIVGCGVHLEIRPGPGHNTADSSLSLPAPIDDGEHTPAWLITPDINALGFSLPGWVLDIVAFFASPYGNGFRLRFGC